MLKLFPKLFENQINSVGDLYLNNKLSNFVSFQPNFRPWFETDTKFLVGVKDAFSEEKADLSGISGKRDLFLSDAIHKAFIEVNHWW